MFPAAFPSAASAASAASILPAFLRRQTLQTFTVNAFDNSQERLVPTPLAPASVSASAASVRVEEEERAEEEQGEEERDRWSILCRARGQSCLHP